MASILLPAKGQVINKKKFYDEFGEEKDEDSGKQKPSTSSEDNKIRRKPVDFEAIFTGNTDDYFRIGVSVAKRTLKVSHINYYRLVAYLWILAILLDYLSWISVVSRNDSRFLGVNASNTCILYIGILFVDDWDH